MIDMRIWAGLLIFLFACAPQEAGQISQPICPDCNVILISIDTLRADHVGVYGYSKDTTPNIDRIAANSYVFTNVRSESSWTAPAHSSLLFSKYPHELNFYSYRRPGKINDSETSLAEILKENDYITQAFTGDAYVSKEYGFDQGFDEYIDTFKFGRFEKFMDNATSWIAENRDKKYFLFLHGYNPHRPYSPPEKYKKLFAPNYTGKDVNVCKRPQGEDLDFAISKYDGEIRYVDELIGSLWEKLVELNQAEKTILIITSDHGEEFYEHGNCDHLKTLYDELLKVPLIIHLPNLKSNIIDSPVQLSDIYPTILELAGVPLKHDVSGTSLVDSLNSSSHKPRPQIGITKFYGVTKKSLTFDGWKIIETSPPWEPIAWRQYPVKPIIDESNGSIELNNKQNKFIVDLADFNQFANKSVFFSAKVRAPDKPVTIQIGFDGTKLWKNSTVDDTWMTVNSSIYTINPENTQVKIIIELLHNESILLDEFLLLDVNKNQILKRFKFDGTDKAYELYSLEEDPKELVNLAYTNEEMLIKLKEELDNKFGNIVEKEGTEVVLREEVEEQLKALGYVG